MTGGPEGGLLLGKRYACATCHTEVIVTKAAPGHLACCGSAMVEQQPKQTASAD